MTTFTAAQIAAAERIRPFLAEQVGYSTDRARSTIDTAKLPASREAMLAAADRADALVAEADAKLVLDLHDAGKVYNGTLTEEQRHVPYMALILALAGAPRQDAFSRMINKIVAAL